MATFSPNNLERLLTRNPGIVGWGEHPSLCAKFARAGLLMAYIDSHGSHMLSEDRGYASLHNLSVDIDSTRINPEKLIG